MNKTEFILTLNKKLPSLPPEELEERLSFYLEMIDDRMEDGISEAEAIAAIGSVDEIAAQILADIPLNKIARETIKSKRRLRIWEIILLILGSPVWLSLLIAGFAVCLSLYAVLWSVIFSFWAGFASLAVCSFGAIMAGIVFACFANIPTGLAALAAGIVCAGLSIFLFYGCKYATKGTLLLTKKLALGVKKCFVKKEGV